MAGGVTMDTIPSRARASGMMPAHHDPDVQSAQRLSRWLDSRGFIDPILGFLLPGAGDLVTSGVGLYMVSIAVRRGLPAVVIARMLVNLSLDTLIGLVPLVGDVGDFFYRAHRKNARLLSERAPRESRPSDWFAVLGAGALFLLTLALPIILLVLALRAIF